MVESDDDDAAPAPSESDGAIRLSDSDDDGPRRVTRAAAAAAGAPPADAAPALPDDVDVEEARMIEAAMLGVPYEPPASRASRTGGVPPPPPSPRSMAARMLRQEQDDAYAASLAADRAKAAEREAEAERAAAAEAATRAEAAAQAAAETAALEAAANAERDAAAAAEAAAGRLPQEPPPGDPCVSVAVRLPDGTRLTRRLPPASAVACLFDLVDAARPDGLAARSYRLVSQYPRKIIGAADADASLAAAGLEGSVALLVEPP